VLLAVVLSILPARIARGQQADLGAGTRPAESIAARLGDRLLQNFHSVWPDPPESVAMFVDILNGSQLGPGEGWFKKAVTQSRFDWDATCKRLDRDGDGRITREEFAGLDADFARLDRDHDGTLGEPDFDFWAHALTPSPGAILFYRADGDGNGKLSHEELDAFFRTADSGGQGFLSLADLQEALSMPARGKGSSSGSPGPTRLTLLKALARQEIGSLQPGPVLGSPAPDFTLRTVDGRKEISLSKVVGPKPIVLVFGNFTCGPFRSQAGNIEKLYRRYRDRATFLMVYVREAHPTGGWQLESNNRIGVAIAQPQSHDERVKVAQICSSRLGLGMPMLVDTIDDAVGARYSGMPSRLYLLDHRGRVAFKNGRGPFGFKPAELEHSLILLLQDEFPELKSKDSAAANSSTKPKDVPAARPARHPSTTASQVSSIRIP
jgi:hypothetical protein